MYFCENEIEIPKESYSRPELLPVGYATDLILGRANCKSKQVAKRIRQLIDESGGNLLWTPAKECRKLQVNLSLVSKQFRKLYQVTMRAYSRQIRMKTAEKLLRDSKRLNVDETARILGYSFTSAFSRSFQNTFGKRPKRYQMQCGNTSHWQTMQGHLEKQDSPLQTWSNSNSG